MADLATSEESLAGAIALVEQLVVLAGEDRETEARYDEILGAVAVVVAVGVRVVKAS